METEGTDLEEPRLKPTGSSKKKSYTVALKLEAVEYGEQHGKHEAARVFNVDRKLIRTWTSQKAWLQTQPLDATRAGAVGRRRMVQGRKTRRGRPLSGFYSSSNLNWGGEGNKNPVGFCLRERRR